MARRGKIRIGKDAKVSVLAKYVYPSKLINQVLPNAESNYRLQNFIIVRLEVKKN